MVEQKVIVVTGSNKGIGKSIVKQLILNSEKYGASNLIVYVTCRKLNLGEDTINEFKQLYKDELAKNKIELKAFKLDISDYSNVDQFKKYLVDTYSKIDVLINNAGVAIQDRDFSAGRIPPTLQINFFDTKYMIDTFLPVLKEGGRMITVSSGLGNLNNLPQAKLPQYLTQDLTVEKVVQHMENFIQSARENKLKESGWPENANLYVVSKIHVTALNFALQLKHDPNQTLILACCPGYCKTDLNRNSGPRHPDEGALTPVHIALEKLEVINNATTPQQKLKGEGVFWMDLIPKPWTLNVVD